MQAFCILYVRDHDGVISSLVEVFLFILKEIIFILARTYFCFGVFILKISLI